MAEKLDEDWDLLVSQGKNSGRQKDVDGSSVYFTRAYELSKNFDITDHRRSQSAYFLAFTKYVQKKNVEALELFSEYLKFPASSQEDLQKHVQVHSLIGSIYFDANQLEQAEKHVRKSLELETKLSLHSWENQQFLSSILMMQKKYAEAIEPLKVLFDYLETREPTEAQKVAVLLAFAYKQRQDEQQELFWQKKNLKLRETINPTQTFVPGNFENCTDLPEGWGLDQLGHFLEVCRQNELSTFVHKQDSYKLLSALNDRFLENRKHLVLALRDVFIKSEEKFSDIELAPEQWLEIYFYLRCHASFTAGVRLALSAQGPETYMVLRGCIENALYAWYVFSDPSLKKPWLERQQSPEAAKLVKKLFPIGEIKRKLLESNKAIGDAVNTAYDETIDRGAHPNVDVFFSNAGQINADGSLVLSVTTLNPGQLDELLKTAVSIGNLVFDIYKLMYPSLIE